MYSTVIAYILWLFSGFGALGFHRFYLGKIPTGLLWMFTGGLLGVGAIYDLITLPLQVRQANLQGEIFDDAWRHISGQNNTWRNVNDGEAKIVREKESLERTILRIAKENKGIIAASEVALAANIPIDEAKKGLDVLVSKGIAELRVRKSGSLVYTIPEIMDRDEPLEDF